MESGIRGNPSVIYTYISRNHWFCGHLTDSLRNCGTKILTVQDLKDQDSRYFTIKRAIWLNQLPTEHSAHTVLVVESQRHDIFQWDRGKTLHRTRPNRLRFACRMNFIFSVAERSMSRRADGLALASCFTIHLIQCEYALSLTHTG